MRKFHKTMTTLMLVLWDVFAVAISIIIGFGLKFGFTNKELTLSYYQSQWEFFILSTIVVLLSNFACRCYSNVWKHAGVTEYLRQITALLLSAVVLMIMVMMFKFTYPELVVMIACLELLLIIGARASLSLISWIDSRVRALKVHKNMKRVAIFGAGEAGVNLVHKLNAHPEDNMLPVCFFDDNMNVWGRKVYGVPVAGGQGQDRADRGGSGNQGSHSRRHGDRSRYAQGTAYNLPQSAHCRLSRFGAIDDVNEKSLSHAQISELNLEDLLRRDSVQLNMKVVKEFIEGKTVLVTGGAGSIGSEICRQVLSFGAKKLLIFDICENGLYEINNELKDKFDPSSYELLLGSVRDPKRLKDVFDNYGPQVVFHAAAHKHVPMMELNPMEAIKNNVFGTMNVASQALASGAEKFILISTDKAVNPAKHHGCDQADSRNNDTALR
jgi:FlaA1/EpsC-like NDP-sugar epimerase